MTNVSLARNATGVARLTMNRPEAHNAFDETMIGELDTAFASLGQDSDVRVIVLAGEGRHFSAGADLRWMQRASEATEAQNLEDARRFATMLARIEACPKPTIARVQGAARGGGVGLACVCDVAIAAADASFAVTEANVGILPAVIGPYLVNAIGRRQARRLALTATRLSADDALAIGLIHQVVPSIELDAAVDKVIAELLEASPNSQREIKQLFGTLSPGPVTPEVRELTAGTIARIRSTDEAREGFAAFLAKRPPRWSNRT